MFYKVMKSVGAILLSGFSFLTLLLAFSSLGVIASKLGNTFPGLIEFGMIVVIAGMVATIIILGQMLFNIWRAAHASY
jgi:hypothetical protein